MGSRDTRVDMTSRFASMTRRFLELALSSGRASHPSSESVADADPRLKDAGFRLALEAELGLRILRGEDVGALSWRETALALGAAHRYLQYHEISPHEWSRADTSTVMKGVGGE